MAIQPTSRTMVGVFYERLIADIKKPLRRMIGRSIVGFEELRTLLSEVEAILNSHPLVKRDDLDDSVLTPSNLLIACSYYAGDLLLLSLNTP